MKQINPHHNNDGHPNQYFQWQHGYAAFVKKTIHTKADSNPV
jgi:hypothetical protein